MPNGATAPGNVSPDRSVPTNGFTNAERSEAGAAGAAQAAFTMRQAANPELANTTLNRRSERSNDVLRMTSFFPSVRLLIAQYQHIMGDVFVFCRAVNLLDIRPEVRYRTSAHPSAGGGDFRYHL